MFTIVSLKMAEPNDELRLPWAPFEEFLECIEIDSKNLRAKCKVCVPKIKILSCNILASSNLRKHLVVCITCLQEITDLNFISLSDATSLTGSLNVRDVLSICVPELTLDLLDNPIMCAACMNSLHVAYDFRSKCLRTEERIRTYIDSVTHETIPSQEASEESITDITLYPMTNVDPTLLKIKTEHPEWFQTDQLEVWIKDEPQSSDDESTSREEQPGSAVTAGGDQQESLSANFIYSQLTSSWNEIVHNQYEPRDTDSGCSSSNADSDMNSSGDSAEGQQLRKAVEAPPKLYQCDICKKSFNCSNLLHLDKKVKKDKPFKCALCKYSQSSAPCASTLRLNLIQHMRELYTRKTPHL